jgi:hypothetical protein
VKRKPSTKPAKSTKKVSDQKKAIAKLKEWRTEAKSDADYESKAAKAYRKKGATAQARVAATEASRAKMFVGIRSKDISKVSKKLSKTSKNKKKR